ncbi:uncharacterized protein CBL_07183 [Carabus blaptoides fortunei]
MAVGKVLLFFTVFITICNAADQKCETNEDCTKYNLVRCVEGICKCEKGKFIKAWTSTPGNSHTAECQLVFDSDCTNDANCTDLQGAVCESNKCICKESYFPDIADRQCVTASKPRGPCQIVQECTPVMGQFAECRDRICLCKSNHYIGQDNKCAKVKAVEATCQFNDECFQEVDGKNALTCEQSKCICLEGYVQKENECVSGANYNAVITSTTLLLMLCGILLA